MKYLGKYLAHSRDHIIVIITIISASSGHYSFSPMLSSCSFMVVTEN